ncbi:hypothetical protein [Caldanaerobacter subterraneus]|uniref:Uncharacterized protein n=1 Tax=Caldanaerobacter subterraneus TaxID=911092 RepID=A0A7Y2PL66_9THEO|nr:hypothetical protein [Caldanaerobacter subterraneus]NNG66400.1 hypothetical protein [Caldanaerobacter subterraneus]
MMKNIIVIIVGIIVLAIIFAMGLKSQTAQVIALIYLIGVIVADIIEAIVSKKRR